MKRSKLNLPEIYTATAAKSQSRWFERSRSVEAVDSLFAKLRSELETYLDKSEVEQTYQAFLLAAKGHQSQKRLTGEPYIIHPVAVARILASMHMDKETIMAALLHDVLEDTEVTKDTIAKDFGKSVAELVDGVSKLTQIKFQSHAEAQAENLQKMMMAMVRDIRVILVKLADRLHNMRTLMALPSEKKQRIARETLDIYAPVANRLGMHGFRVEFEDLCFSALYPMRYRVIKNALEKRHGNRRAAIRHIEKDVKKSLKERKIDDWSIKYRTKHLFGIYKKMKKKNLLFTEVTDVFRIVVDNIDSCYRVLGVIHNLYKPVPERFKDYIAIPKTNGYQALHTTLNSPTTLSSQRNGI